MRQTGKGAHGRALMRFLDNELAALGHAPTGWAREHNITASNLKRWRDEGVDPTLGQLEDVAAALGRPLVDLLIEAGYITRHEVGGRTVTPTPPPDVEFAIEHDPNFKPEHEKQVLRTAVAMILGNRHGKIRQRTYIKIGPKQNGRVPSNDADKKSRH